MPAFRNVVDQADEGGRRRNAAFTFSESWKSDVGGRRTVDQLQRPAIRIWASRKIR
jgi:hypothetical protein